MFVPWLELAALAERTERDLNGTAMPFARNDEGAYFW